MERHEINYEELSRLFNGLKFSYQNGNYKLNLDSLNIKIDPKKQKVQIVFLMEEE